MRLDLNFRRFMESQGYPQRPGSSAFGNPSPKTLDHTGSINFELGSTDKDQAQVSPYVGSGVSMGKTTLAGLPSFQVLSMNDKTVTLKVDDVGWKVLKNLGGGHYAKDPNPDGAERTITLPRWQYERLITRGLDQQGAGGAGAGPPPPGGMPGMM